MIFIRNQMEVYNEVSNYFYCIFLKALVIQENAKKEKQTEICKTSTKGRIFDKKGLILFKILILFLRSYTPSMRPSKQTNYVNISFLNSFSKC